MPQQSYFFGNCPITRVKLDPDKPPVSPPLDARWSAFSVEQVGNFLVVLADYRQAQARLSDHLLYVTTFWSPEPGKGYSEDFFQARQAQIRSVPREYRRLPQRFGLKGVFYVPLDPQFIFGTAEETLSVFVVNQATRRFNFDFLTIRGGGTKGVVSIGRVHGGGSQQTPPVTLSDPIPQGENRYTFECTLNYPPVDYPGPFTVTLVGQDDAYSSPSWLTIDPITQYSVPGQTGGQPVVFTVSGTPEGSLSVNLNFYAFTELDHSVTKHASFNPDFDSKSAT